MLELRKSKRGTPFVCVRERERGKSKITKRDFGGESFGVGKFKAEKVFNKESGKYSV
jgi:hypothetical protein